MAAMASQLADDGESGARGVTPAANPKFLLELIIADLHWSSLQVGSLALMAAAASASGSIAELHSCRHLVYDDTRVMRLALRYGSEAGLADEIRDKLDLLYAAIGKSLKPMAAFVQPLTLSHSVRDQLPQVLPALRKVTQMAAECLTLLESVTRSALNLDYCEDSVVIRQFLARAARGQMSIWTVAAFSSRPGSSSAAKARAPRSPNRAGSSRRPASFRPRSSTSRAGGSAWSAKGRSGRARRSRCWSASAGSKPWSRASPATSSGSCSSSRYI